VYVECIHTGLDQEVAENSHHLLHAAAGHAATISSSTISTSLG
jgi:hypothetical protein